MDNVLETNGVPLTVFGGAVPELAPEDLPEGASPFNQDVDYNPGSVFTRGGRQSQYTYANLVLTENPGFGASVPGSSAPNESPWSAPNNLTTNVPATPAVVVLNGVSAFSPFTGISDTHGALTSPATWTITIPAGTLALYPRLYVVWMGNPSGAFNVTTPGWTAGPLFSASLDFGEVMVGGTATFSFNGAGAQPTYCGLMVAASSDGRVPTLVNGNAFGGNNGGGNSNVGPVTLPVLSSGTVLICSISETGSVSGATPTAWDPAHSTLTDTQNNTYILIAQSQFQTSNTGMTGNSLWVCYNPVPAITGATVSCAMRTTTGGVMTGNYSMNLREITGWIVDGVFGPVDQVLTGSGSALTFTTATLTPSYPNSTVMIFVANAQQQLHPISTPVGWGRYVAKLGITNFADFQLFSATGPVSFTTSWTGSANAFAYVMLNLPNSGPINPYPFQVVSNASNGWPQNPLTITLGATQAGNMIIATAYCCNTTSAPLSCTFSDTQQNKYTVYSTGGGSNGTAAVFVGIAQNIKGSASNNVITMVQTGTGSSVVSEAYELFMGPVPPNTATVSQILQATGYPVIPAADTVMGIEVLVSGKQTSSNPTSIIKVSLNVPGSQTINTQLGAVNGTVVVGSPTTNWGLNLNAALVNQLTFGANVVAQSPFNETISIYGVQVKLFLSPNPPSNFNWIKTYEQTDAEIDTLALDATGVLWDEDVDTNPTVLTSIFNTILPNTFAKSVTFSDIEYIAFSNLLQGTDVPRQWNGQFLDRISMVGPGAQVQAAVAGGAGGSNTTAIQTITQPPQVAIRRISWGASINAQSDSTPGNVLVVSIPGGSTHGGNQPLNMPLGTNVVLSSITNPFPLKGGGSLPYNLNGTYIIQSTGTPIIGGSETDTAFTLQAPAVQYGYSNDFGSPPSSGWFYQSCVATVTMQQPLPNVGAGSQIQITGASAGAYNGLWTVLTAPNASSMTITSVQLSGTGTSGGPIATYTYTLAGGSSNPTQGQPVTTLNVLNGSGIGSTTIFNVTNVAIQSVSPGLSGGSFSIPLSGSPADIPPQAQGGTPPATAQVSGTIFTFDAGQIIGNSTGGSIVGQGQVGVGVRKVCVSFLTRSGFITQPSPIQTFNVTTGSGSIQVNNIPTGPPNVVARILSFTGANGGNFFYIPQDVVVNVSGQNITNTATVINDNTTTSKTFSFSDAVLLSATAIDIPGNNLFNCIELGSCRGLLTYASRMVAWSEQQKVTNLRNLSFDGGFQGQIIGNINFNTPLGWTVDTTLAASGNLQTNPASPVFGWCYQILNNTGSTQALAGTVTQPAWQDEFGVPIISANTLYSVRITAQCTPAQASGNLVVDLFSASTGQGTTLGSFSIPLASMTTNMQIYTGTLLTTALSPVPKDLLIRIYATNMLNGAQILIDRIEPFQTLVPVNTTAFKMSYVNNQESFDLVTGVCGPNQNMQPINGGMVLFDLLYALKEKSWYSTFDNGVTEPNKWGWKEVSNKVGTIGIHSYDFGEGWAVTANRQGVFFFEGGEPIKISQEIQPLWDSINWQYGYTIWLRNDPEQRRLTVGVPIATPNAYMPEFPTNANPASPNVILMCNYRELNTGSALAQTGPIRSTYTGRLMSPEPARKWSFWNILCPYSDFISRANNNWPQFYCTGYQDSKIFALQAASLNDDGNAINSFWISYGFVKPEAADAKGLGLFRMEFPYFTVLATGSGTLNAYVYPESPQNQPYVLDPQTLPAISQGDLEIGVNVKGQRFFVRVGTNAVGSAFRCSKMVVPLIADTWSPVRGSNLITA